MASKAKPDKRPFEDDDHRAVVSQFEEFANAVQSSGAQAMWQKCRNYRDGKQHTDKEEKTLKKRGQPIITDNKIQDKCDTLLGIEKQMRTDPKAYPRNPSNEDMNSAEAASDALRFIADQSHFNIKVRKGAADNLMVEGVCVGQVIVEKKKGQTAKVCMERIRQDRSYYDIRSLEDDFSDKTYCGYFTWMDESEVLRTWKGAKDQIEGSQTDSGSVANDSFDDKPRYISIAGKRKRLQVFTHYHQKDGVWHESTWIRGGWLDAPRPCVYKDEFGDPACCLELQALYRDAEGSPYGVVQRYLDLQDEHNKRRSKMLHLLTAKRVKMRKGAVDSVNVLRAEIHKPDGVVEINGSPEDLAIEDNLKEAEGQWRLLQQTDIALSQTGPNSAIAGTSGDLSGIAKARDQQAGQLPISPLFDALDSWQLRMFQQAWCRVRQFWTAETWVRVTDSEDKPKWVGLNEPVTHGERQAQALKNDPQFQAMSPEDQQATISQLAMLPRSQQQAIDDVTGKPLTRNNVGQMDIDIIIDRGQDVITVQQEEFAQLMDVAKVRPEIPFDVLIDMSQLRQTTKKRVMERLKGQGNDPMAAAKAMQQVQEQAQLLQEQAQALQQESEQLQSEKAQVTQAKADLAVKSADLSVQSSEIDKKIAQFDTHVAQVQAKDAQNKAAEAESQATSTADESSRRGEELSQQIAATAQAIEQLQKVIDVLAARQMQTEQKVAQPPPAAPRIKHVQMKRDGSGQPMAVPVYEDPSMVPGAQAPTVQ